MIRTVPSLAPFFEGAQVSAFRLESRRRYALTYEAHMFDDFVAGRNIHDPAAAEWFRPWLDMVRTSPAQWQRVRIIDEPATDYQRFAAWCGKWNTAAGEDIRYLPRVWANRSGILSDDWWLFDETTVVRMLFDDFDDIASYELIDAPAEVRAFRKIRKMALRAAENARFVLPEPVTLSWRSPST